MQQFGKCEHVCCASSKICCNCCRTRGPKMPEDDLQSNLEAARQNFITNQMNERSFRMRLIFLGLNPKEVENEVRDHMSKRTRYLMETLKGHHL